MTKNILNIMNWWNKYSNTDLLIKSYTLEIDIKIEKSTLPHLIGLHYINSKNEELKGIRLFNYIKKNKFSDEEIFSLIKRNNINQLENIKDRVKYFKGFMENLEESHIVEMTNPKTKLKSNYLIVQTDEKIIMQLGVKNIEYKYIFETFIVRQDNDYFKETAINEPIISIQKYNENGELEPFSFKENFYKENIKDIDIINDLEKEDISEQINIQSNQNLYNFDLEL